MKLTIIYYSLNFIFMERVDFRLEKWRSKKYSIWIFARALAPVIDCRLFRASSSASKTKILGDDPALCCCCPRIRVLNCCGATIEDGFALPKQMLRLITLPSSVDPEFVNNCACNLIKCHKCPYIFGFFEKGLFRILLK